MIERVFVLAGSFQQSEYWRKRYGYSRRVWVFLHDPRQLAGTQHPRYVRLGTWDTQRGLEAILQQLQICQAEEMTLMEDWPR